MSRVPFAKEVSCLCCCCICDGTLREYMRNCGGKTPSHDHRLKKELYRRDLSVAPVPIQPVNVKAITESEPATSFQEDMSEEVLGVVQVQLNLQGEAEVDTGLQVVAQERMTDQLQIEAPPVKNPSVGERENHEQAPPMKQSSRSGSSHSQCVNIPFRNPTHP
ncbi:unnamed protein product [Amoebophrya sp. A120]|nr:unnamed protein product [Amoebophrya sp. A120]|eukprot:GSA120T00020775001.1